MAAEAEEALIKAREAKKAAQAKNPKFDPTKAKKRVVKKNKIKVIKNKHIVEVCASEGKTCQCTGKVFYGVKKPFGQMVKQPHKTAQSQGSIQCNNGVFGDPTPGIAKQCFC